MASKVEIRIAALEKAAKTSHDAAMSEELPEALRAYYAKLALHLDKKARKLSLDLSAQG